MSQRHAISLTATDEVAKKIEKISKLYRGAVSVHRILTRATVLGLEILANSPDKLIEKEGK